jgi:hypothetical protein
VSKNPQDTYNSPSCGFALIVLDSSQVATTRIETGILHSPWRGAKRQKAIGKILTKKKQRQLS